MALIKYLSAADAPARSSDVLEASGGDDESSPLIQQALAHNPHVLETRVEYFRQLMGEGTIDRELKELVYIVVSEANACEYCVGAHSNIFIDEVGGDPVELEAIRAGDFERLDDRKRAVAEFAHQTTVDPKRVTVKHLTDLFEVGFDERDVVELLTVAATAKGANTFVDALNIHPADR